MDFLSKKITMINIIYCIHFLYLYYGHYIMASVQFHTITVNYLKIIQTQIKKLYQMNQMI